MLVRPLYLQQLSHNRATSASNSSALRYALLSILACIVDRSMGRDISEEYPLATSSVTYREKRTEQNEQKRTEEEEAILSALVDW